VYIEALKSTLARDQGAILLVPEIGLTPQVVARIRAALDEPVVVLHSGLTAARRVAAWREVLEGRARVVVGPRSAIFAPVKNLGLIVVDEEHEESYKQLDPAPRYHARDVALVRGQRNGAVVLLVSATPSFESIRLVDEGQLAQLRLTQRFGSAWPIVTVLDRRREEADAPYIGAHLAREIEVRAKKGEGVVLLITRRGFAPVLTCGDCGARIECPNCSIPLTYHGGRRTQLRCHLCGITKRVPDQCPSCHGDHLRPLGAGTQRIEEEVQRRFPTLAPIRMDADTTRAHGEHERILRAFSEGDAGLLLGTQVVAKGHDFEHVTLVGVVNADPVLFQPDFRAAERTFRLLVQAAGRAGRGERMGEVIVQTLDPDNPVFNSIMQPDVDGFARQQLAQRRELNYPPYVRMAMVTVTSATPERAEEGAENLAKTLRRQGSAITLRGPVPAFVARVKRQWRWRLMISTPRERDPQGRILRENLRRAIHEVKLPPATTSIIDIDPLEVV
ncbi:MAG: primosomal protein N', partial [bacterium]